MTGGIDTVLRTAGMKDSEHKRISRIIGEYTFVGFAKVTKNNNNRVDCEVGSTKFTNVEVMVLGINGYGVKLVPDVGDRVLLIASKIPITDLKKFEPSFTMPLYDNSGIKCIPVTDIDTAQLLTVDKDKIELTGDNKFLLNSDGISVEDVNENKVDLTADGISFEDTNGNKITAASSGVTIEDTNGCVIETSSSSVKINGKLEIKK